MLPLPVPVPHISADVYGLGFHFWIPLPKVGFRPGRPEAPHAPRDGSRAAPRRHQGWKMSATDSMQMESGVQQEVVNEGLPTICGGTFAKLNRAIPLSLNG